MNHRIYHYNKDELKRKLLIHDSSDGVGIFSDHVQETPDSGTSIFVKRQVDNFRMWPDTISYHYADSKWKIFNSPNTLPDDLKKIYTFNAPYGDESTAVPYALLQCHILLPNPTNVLWALLVYSKSSYIILLSFFNHP